jgi:hypothetical protein
MPTVKIREIFIHALRSTIPEEKIKIKTFFLLFPKRWNGEISAEISSEMTFMLNNTKKSKILLIGDGLFVEF